MSVLAELKNTKRSHLFNNKSHTCINDDHSFCVVCPGNSQRSGSRRELGSCWVSEAGLLPLSYGIMLGTVPNVSTYWWQALLKSSNSALQVTPHAAIPFVDPALHHLGLKGTRHVSVKESVCRRVRWKCMCEGVGGNVWKPMNIDSDSGLVCRQNIRSNLGEKHLVGLACYYFNTII